MLFPYVDNTDDFNWLNDCLTIMLDELLQKITNDQEILTWPACIPEVYRTKLSTKTSIRDKWSDFCNAFQELNEEQRDLVVRNFQNQNEISRLLEGEELPLVIFDELPEGIQEVSKSLFLAAFKLLSSAEIRSSHYQDLHDKMNKNILCPFCGLEALMRPVGAENDYDHFIPKSIYPYAAANMKNLPPMGRSCNRDYKKAQNTVLDLSGNRREMFNPYGTESASFSITDTYPLPSLDEDLDVKIEFTGPERKAAGWRDIFRIDERYTCEIENRIDEYVESFAVYAKEVMKFGNTSFEDLDYQKLKDFLESYLRTLEKTKLTTAHLVIGYAIIEMLVKHVTDNDERVVKHLLRVVEQQL